MNASNAGAIHFPQYGQGPFVERDEAEHVRKHVVDLATGRPTDVCAVVFTAEPGVGKTWLLRHLAEVGLSRDGTHPVVGNALGDRTIGGVSDVHSLYLSLQDWTGEPESATKALIIAVDKKISGWATLKPTTLLGGGDVASLGDLSRWLEADVRSLLSGNTKALVLLLDHAHESPWDLLKLLDQHVLGPLAAIPRVFTVIAGRGQPYPWQAPDLRLHTEALEIKPFDIEQTRQQLEGQLERAFSEQEVAEIWKLSVGYPRTNYALGFLGRARWRDAFDFELQHMFESVPDPQRRKPMRECLEALCVLERFRDEQILPMLAGYYQKPDYAGQPLSEASALREELRRYAFVRWDDTPPAMWKIHGRLRTLLVNWAKSDQYLWVRMHCTAYTLFTRWAARYEKTRDRWQGEAERHKKALAEDGAKPTDCRE